MQISKWGNSLAVRLPAAVVDALARLRKLRRALSTGFVFDREEANSR
jgi:hypothetical protein